jgi:prepilin-type N-terminal cleavage/methylation domain-containing protein
MSIDKPRQPNILFTDQGYTLIEIMIAISIFAIGFLAIAYMQITSSKNSRTGSEITEAATIATDRMEMLMVLAFDDPLLDPAVNPHPSAPDNTQGKYSIQWIVADNDLNADGINDSKVIDMSVSWPGAGNKAVNIDFIKPDM